MSETKYGKYFVQKPITEGMFAPRIRFSGGEYFGEINFSLQLNCITEPWLVEEGPHLHDFDQFLFFYGSNPMDLGDFRAEVELSLGEEGEKHIINSMTVVHIPKRLIHCPLFFKKIEKPIMFMNVSLTPEYKKTVGDEQIAWR
jgi:hypothetical protein